MQTTLFSTVPKPDRHYISGTLAVLGLCLLNSDRALQSKLFVKIIAICLEIIAP